MTNNINSFIEKYKNQINNNEWNNIYYAFMNPYLSQKEVGMFTYMMLECNINPLLHMDSVPLNYLYGYEGNKHLKIDIPDNIECISIFAFKNAHHLEYVNIPKSVNVIEGNSLPKDNIPIYIPYNSLMEFQEKVRLLGIDIYSGEYLFISSLTGNVLTKNNYDFTSVYNPHFYNNNGCKTLREEIEEAVKEWELKSSFDDSIMSRWQLHPNEIKTFTNNNCWFNIDEK